MTQPIILSYADKTPIIHETAYIAPGATVTGDVTIGAEASVWFNVSMRGDVGPIHIGDRSNIQDNSVVHNTKGLECHIGAEVTVGHGCILHAVTIHNRALIGMGSTLLDNVVVEAGAVVGAGSLVTPGKTVPAGQLWAGRPARFVRDLTEEDIQTFARNYQEYVRVSREYMKAAQ